MYNNVRIGTARLIVRCRPLHEKRRESPCHRRIFRRGGGFQGGLQQDSDQGKSQARTTRGQTRLLLRPHQRQRKGNSRIPQRHPLQAGQHRHTPRPGTPADEGGRIQGGGKRIPIGIRHAARQPAGQDRTAIRTHGASRKRSRLALHSQEDGPFQLPKGRLFANALRRRVRPTILHLNQKRGAGRRTKRNNRHKKRRHFLFSKGRNGQMATPGGHRVGAELGI